jgi:hypothetical protein
LSQSINAQFASTHVPVQNRDAACFVAFPHGGHAHCCAFTGGAQPFMLDADHYYMALGSGKLSADPFLRFLVDIFCTGGRPSVHTATLLAAWTVEHTSETTQGGVAPPIRIGVLETVNGALAARELPDSEVDTHLQAVKSGHQALRDWRDRIQAGQVPANTQPVPQAPAAGPVPPTQPAGDAMPVGQALPVTP